MSITAKPIVAGTLLLGVAAVWIPRLTGFDPLGFLPEEEQVSSGTAIGVPSSGGAASTKSDGEDGESPSDSDEISISSLEEVVQFLENRDKQKPKTVEAAPGADSIEKITVDPVFDAAAHALFDPRVESSSSSEDSPAGDLQTFLEANPLHTIVSGNGLTTATFGYLRVEVGNNLWGERLKVSKIESQGVLLESSSGTLRVPLPPPGARLIAVQSVSQSSESSEEE